MKYEEIKQKVKEAVEKQENITDKELEDLDDELCDLLYEATEREKGELVSYISDINIYSKITKGISIHSEPRVLRSIISDLRYELSRPKDIREKVEWRLTYLKGGS